MNKPTIMFYLLPHASRLTPHAFALLSVTGAPPRLDEHIARVTEAQPSLCLRSFLAWNCSVQLFLRSKKDIVFSRQISTVRTY
ncbi:unnamed protein product [Camellia sinensis]